MVDDKGTATCTLPYIFEIVLLFVSLWGGGACGIP